VWSAECRVRSAGEKSKVRRIGFRAKILSPDSQLLTSNS
jgi:hypothetical protein